MGWKGVEFCYKGPPVSSPTSFIWAKKERTLRSEWGYFLAESCSMIA